MSIFFCIPKETPVGIFDLVDLNNLLKLMLFEFEYNDKRAASIPDFANSCPRIFSQSLFNSLSVKLVLFINCKVGIKKLVCTLHAVSNVS